MTGENAEGTAEIRRWLNAVKSALPARFELIETEAQIIYEVRLCRAALMWRIEELGRSACDSCDKGDFVAALLLARGVQETACALWCLKDLVLKQVETGFSPAIAESVARLLKGPKAIHVMTLVRAADKAVPGVLSSYDFLSEATHPNFLGTIAPFLKVELETRVVHLGREMSVINYRVAIVAHTQFSLRLVEAADSLITQKMPEFIKRSEGAPLHLRSDV